MHITTSNIIDGANPSVSVGASSDLPGNVTNQDFSLTYTGSSPTTLVFDFGNVIGVSYVAVGGILVKGNGDGNSFVQILDNGVSVGIHYTVRDHCHMFVFEERSFSNLQIKLFNGSTNQAPTLSYAMAGAALEIPNGGEVAGYERQWANRNLKSKTTFNNLGAPVSTLKKRFPSKGALRLPNMLKTFSNSTWQNFLDFGVENLFFINEDVTKEQFSYVCYDLEKASTRAHNQTRELNNLSISFKVYNGL